MLICINNKCVDYSRTEKRNCKRKRKWEGCKKANLYDFDAPDPFAGSRMDGYHCASGGSAGDEMDRKP